MKLLTVSLLVCATMALTGADGEESWTNTSDNTMADQAVTEAEPDETAAPSDQEGEIQIVKARYSACYRSRCFTYFPTPLRWADAERNCHRLGGNLASVHSLSEHNVIQNMIFKVTNTFPVTWLGGSDAQQEGTWFWSDGTRFDFTYWARREPNNFRNADCLVMNYGGSRRFDDQPCHYKRPSVCAKKA